MLKTLFARLLLNLLLVVPLSALAVDPATLPKEKITKLGLYIEARDVPEFLKKYGKEKVLFLDLRTPEELLFVGMPEGIDGNVPFGIMHYDQWDEKKSTYVRNPNLDFLANFESRAMDKGTEKNDPILLICRSDDRSALGADFLARHGYTNVWSVVEALKATWPKTAPTKAAVPSTDGRMPTCRGATNSTRRRSI